MPFFQLPPDSSGKFVATDTLTRDAQTEHVQWFEPADANTGLTAGVTAGGSAPGAGRGAMAVQGIGNGTPIPVNMESQKATYSVAIFGHTPAATPTDFLTILGSNTKTVRVQRIWICGRATAATWYRIRLLKYSAIYTGGTASAATIVPHDSGDAAATAVVNTWSGGLPTVGTLVGAVHDDMLPLNASALTATQPFAGEPGLLYDFSIRNGKGLVLRGATQYLSLNANAVALPAGTVIDMKVEFSEE